MQIAPKWLAPQHLRQEEPSDVHALPIRDAVQHQRLVTLLVRVRVIENPPPIRRIRAVSVTPQHAITDKLAAMNYSGWIVVEAEQDPAKAPPYEYSKLGYETIVAACRKAGLEIAP